MKQFKYFVSSIRRHFDSRKLENLNYRDCRSVFRTNCLWDYVPRGVRSESLGEDADRHRLRYAELSVYIPDEYAIQSDNPR